MDLQLLGRVLTMRRTLRAHDQWTRPEVEAHHQAAEHRLRAFAYQRSPFYRRFHAGLLDRPLAELPILTKAALMETSTSSSQTGRSASRTARLTWRR